MRRSLRYENIAPSGVLALLVAATSAGCATPAIAQASDDKVWVEVSGYTPSIETKARIDTASGRLGTSIRFEDDLNFDDRQTLPAGLVGFRLGSGFSLTAEYFSLRREATAGLDREIRFGDVTFPVAASVTGEFNTDIYRLAANYAVIRRADFDAGVSAGVHATDVEVSIEGQGSVGNSGLRFERRSQSLLAPMPTVGVFANVNVLPRFGLSGRVDYFSLGIGKYDAKLLNAQVSAMYRIHRNIGIGLGYRHVEYRVIATGEHLIGRVDYNFDGPAVYIRAGF
jgi:hypothetical protein